MQLNICWYLIYKKKKTYWQQEKTNRSVKSKLNQCIQICFLKLKKELLLKYCTFKVTIKFEITELITSKI